MDQKAQKKVVKLKTSECFNVLWKIYFHELTQFTTYYSTTLITTTHFATHVSSGMQFHETHSKPEFQAENVLAIIGAEPNLINVIRNIQ